MNDAMVIDNFLNGVTVSSYAPSPLVVNRGKSQFNDHVFTRPANIYLQNI